MDKIFISACLLGENVRYDGKHQKLSEKIILQWRKEGRLVGGCPECLGGLPVPRDPAEIDSNSKQVITVNGENVTLPFMTGAQKALDLCEKENIKFALLKESSPSCGSNNIYDGSFSKRKITGEGVTAALLTKNGIRVFSESTINELAQLIR